MAQRTIIQLVDDIDGTEIADGEGETVNFSLDGGEYTIDLTNKNADKFRGLFQDYIAAGTKVTGGKRGGGRKGATSGPTPADIRAWAKEQGLDVPDRGRVSDEVRAQYDAAH